MSVYGGFLTKKQSEQYYHVLEDLIKIIESAVIESLTKNIIDYTALRQPFLKSYKKLQKLQIRKYMQPKYSTTLKPLFDICFDHAFFPERIFNISENNSINYQNNFKDIESIKRSIDLNSKQLKITDDNPLQSYRFMKPKTFREPKSQNLNNTITGTNNQMSTLIHQQRPNTTEVTRHRKNKSIPISARLGSYLHQPKTFRKQIYQSFQKDYTLPSPSIQFQKKLSLIRRGTKVKYQIQQLF